MGEVEFGWVIPPGGEVADRGTFVADVDRALARAAGAFNGAWAVDHLQEGGEADQLEGWTLATYFAARHPGLRVGHVVLSQAFRNPALLAKMMATLQFLSGGRFVLGIGAGWYEPEYRAYNYDFSTPGGRLAQLDEAVRIIKALWSEPQATFAGQHYQVNAAYCEPKPDPLPPIMIGGSKPRMFRLIARHADWWCVGWTSLARYREQVAEMARACAEVGRDPATLRRVWFGPCACAATEAGVQTLLDRVLPGTNRQQVFAGTPAQLIAQVNAFVALGVTYFQFWCVDFPQTGGLDLLINEVLPGVTGAA
jgi:alkanesulfonate monooxygenase SsuD/methylene tetrahydromethanopterin reductase-like flavin-dependent oxidoreductase (luciferase family)